jgi:diguanylate cyclase (GGDEF)-like protein
LSKPNKINSIYFGLGLIPILLLLLPQADPTGTFVHAFTTVFPYPLYMGFALVGFLCFKINQIRMLFSILLLLGICCLLFNPLSLEFMGIKTWGVYNLVPISFPLTLAIIFSIRETRPMDLPNFGRLFSSLIPFIVLGYLSSRDASLFNKIALFKILPVKGFLFPQLALVSLAIFGVVILLQRDRIVKPFVRVFGITLIPLMVGMWAGLALYSDMWRKLAAKLPRRTVQDKQAFAQNLDADVLTAFPSLPIVAALTIICAVLLHMIFQMYWHRVYVDELTDVANRRALDEHLSHLSGEYAIAMMDIDHFKAFNDNYGHDEGDNVLRLVGSILSQELGDRVYRYGGEEFCAVFKGVSAEDAYMFANKVRRKLEERAFYIRKPNSKREYTSAFDRRKTKKSSNGKKVQITISIGLANPTKKTKTVEDVVKLADQALYEAKRKGRNRVVISETESVKSAV